MADRITVTDKTLTNSCPLSVTVYVFHAKWLIEYATIQGGFWWEVKTEVSLKLSQTHPTYNKQMMPMYNQWLHDHSLIPYSELQGQLIY